MSDAPEFPLPDDQFAGGSSLTNSEGLVRVLNAFDSRLSAKEAEGTEVEQSDWYVDGVNGDDDNDGASWTTALATVGAIRKKWGRWARFEDQNAVTIHIAYAVYNEVLDLSGWFSGDNSIVNIIGYPSVVRTGTVGTFEFPLNGAPNGRPGTLTDPSVVDWTGDHGYRVHFDPEGSNDSVSFIGNHPISGTSEATLGAAVKSREDSGGASFQSVSSFPGGTSYAIEALPTFLGLNIDAARYHVGSGGSNTSDSFYIKHLAFSNPVGTTQLKATSHGEASWYQHAAVLFYGCQFEGNFYQSAASFYGCGWARAGSSNLQPMIFYDSRVNVRGCIASGGTFNNCIIEGITGPEGAGYTQFSGTYVNFKRTKSYSGSTLNFGVFSSATKGVIKIDPDSSIHFGRIFGSNYSTSADAYAIAVAGKAWFKNGWPRKYPRAPTLIQTQVGAI